MVDMNSGLNMLRVLTVLNVFILLIHVFKKGVARGEKKLGEYKVAEEAKIREYLAVEEAKLRKYIAA
jgi:hypothetical protein